MRRVEAPWRPSEMRGCRRSAWSATFSSYSLSRPPGRARRSIDSLRTLQRICALVLVSCATPWLNWHRYARLLDPVTPEGFQFDYDDFLKQQEDIIRMPLPEKSPPPSPLPSTPSETALAQSAELSPTMPPPVQSVNVSHAAQFLATRYTSPTPPGASTDVATILGRARGDWRSPLPPARSLYPQHLSLSLSPRERLALRPSQPMRSPSPLPPLPKFSLAPSPMPKILTYSAYLFLDYFTSVYPCQSTAAWDSGALV